MNNINNFFSCLVLKMNSRTRKMIKVALQKPSTNYDFQNNMKLDLMADDLEYVELTPVPPIFPDVNNVVFKQIMDSKSGPKICSDTQTISNESLDTTEWLPLNKNKSNTSSSSRKLFAETDSLIFQNNVACFENAEGTINLDIEETNKETSELLEEALVVRTEGLVTNFWGLIPTKN